MKAARAAVPMQLPPTRHGLLQLKPTDQRGVPRLFLFYPQHLVPGDSGLRVGRTVHRARAMYNVLAQPTVDAGMRLVLAPASDSGYNVLDRG